MRTAQRGSIPIAWTSVDEVHQGLVELARCRSDLFRASSLSRRARKDHAGLTLRWLASNDCPRVMTAHRMRAFLLARATTAFCHPERSRKASTQREMRSLRRWAVMTADLAAWMNSVRR